jgi:alkylated DNA nucleotide flippase Atl1
LPAEDTVQVGDSQPLAGGGRFSSSGFSAGGPISLEFSMSSARAQAVADVLYELNKAEKLGTLTGVARRAGFNPGVNGKTALNVLENVRREWPHLQWWRVVRDDGTLCFAEQADALTRQGIAIADDRKSVLVDERVVMEFSDDALAPPKKTVPMN